MNNNAKSKAEKILKYMCLGGKIEGFKFSGLTILISESNINKRIIKGQIYINIEDVFQIFESMPSEIPVFNDEHLESYDEACLRIIKLRLKTIINVTLGDIVPHLILTFDDGQVMIVNGYNMKYECWQVEVQNQKQEDEMWCVVAGPCGEISSWGPECVTNGFLCNFA